MSFAIYDENGYVADFATTKGAIDYFIFLKGLEIEEAIEFITYGQFIVPSAFLEALIEVDPPVGSIRDTHESFLKTLAECEGIVILSDGINDDLEDLDEGVS